MSEPSLPKFPATPEEIKAASEKAMNFWVGALSPMWVPFWAASSFGLGAWAVSQSMTKKMGEGLASPDALMKDMPTFGVMAAKWPALPGVWGAFGAEAAAKATEKAAYMHSPVPVPEMFTGVSAAMAAALAPTEIEAPEKTVAPEPVVTQPSKPQPSKLKTAKPAAVKAAAVKPVATKVSPAKPAPVKPVPVKIEPKPIAKSMSAAKPPKPKA